MIKIDPIKIIGRWNDGYALDVHTRSSIFLGHDEFGHPQFDTARSEIGELLYRLKNKSDKSGIAQIVEVATWFLRSKKATFDSLVPVPATRHRLVQPVLLLGEELAKALEIDFRPDWVSKTKNFPELKNVFDLPERTRLLDKAFTADKLETAGRKVLLFDDLFRSGATLNEVASTLFDMGGAESVFALTITKTRSKI